MDAHAINLLEELQLRRWARMNYLPPHKREKLHPVALAEMQIMDRESSRADAATLAAEHQNRRIEPENTVVTRFVPLADNQQSRLDLPHARLEGPKFLRQTRKRTTTRFVDNETSSL